MREILFRGKTIAIKSEWVEGFYNHIPCGRFLRDEHCIQTIDEGGRIGQLYDVYESTVGQFTGLTDKNGKKIFEGDIVKLSFEGTSREYDGDFSEYSYDIDFDGHKIGIVTFGGYGTFLKVSHGELYIDGEKQEDWKPSRKSRLAAYRSEVIGNIHDNPELLEVKDGN